MTEPPQLSVAVGVEKLTTIEVVVEPTDRLTVILEYELGPITGGVVSAVTETLKVAVTYRLASLTVSVNEEFVAPARGRDG